MGFRFPVTIAIISVNVIVFGILAWQLQSIMMDNSLAVLTILKAGANLNPFTLGGQPWRIITSMFLHFGVLHLAVNMYGLYSLGQFLEPAIGSVRFTILYMICGIAAGIASLQFNVFVISAGASGAIFGLYGYHLGAEVIGTFKDWEKLRVVLINFVIFVVINGMIAGQVNVDMSGHIGGALAGLIIAFCHFKLQLLRDKFQMGAVMVVLPLLLFALPHSQVKYYELFQRVVTIEKATENLYDQSMNDAQLADSLIEVKKEWNSINQGFAQLGAVPSALASDTSTLGRYVAIREKETEYRIEFFREEYIYIDSIEFVNQQLAEIPKLKYHLNYESPTDSEIKEPDTAKHQSPAVNQVQVFYDENWREIATSYNAKYYRVGVRDSLGRWQGNVRDYYENGDLQMRGRYINDLRDGVFVYYSNHHTYSSAGRYEKENAVGKWKTFHWNGKPETEVFYDPEYFMNYAWDSLGQAQVSGGNGEYKTYYANGNLKEKGNYVQGKREGYWFGYHENGKPYYKELYKGSRLISGVSENLAGKRFVYDQLSQLPFPKISMSDYRKYIDDNKRNPSSPDQHGVVKILFNVGQDGSLWDFIVLEGISHAHDREAIRLIREGPPWRPAFLHGDQKIQSQGYMTVNF
jgi:membrane associated rhomboid family serine protease/antitoxin component YwqK of YwqJK toxin-antitoxin module